MITGQISSYEQILNTEYNKEFDHLRMNAMVTSFHKYGPVAANYGKKDGNWEHPKGMCALDSITKNLNDYKRTGNLDCLVNVANFAMMEFTYPSVDNAFLDLKAEGKSNTVGVSVKELDNYDNISDLQK